MYRSVEFIWRVVFVQVGQGYPHDPPKVKCETMVYHPNIDLEGNVCLNILRSALTESISTAVSESLWLWLHLWLFFKLLQGGSLWVCVVSLCLWNTRLIVCSVLHREDWKPVLTINSIIYGLQYLFLVSTALLLPLGVATLPLICPLFINVPKCFQLFFCNV